MLNYVISRDFNHAGGMQIFDETLVVPVENKVDSKILFFDVKDPERPRRLKTEIIRKNKLANAVGIYKEKSENAGRERFVLLVKAGDLDVYYSTSGNLEDTDFELKYTWKYDDIKTQINSAGHFEDYQNINLINQDNGQIYFIGLYNNTTRLFRSFSKDYADLFRLEIDKRERMALTKITRKSFSCQEGFWGNRYCNFDAGAGVFMDERDGMIIYAVADKPKNGIATFVEYSSSEKK